MSLATPPSMDQPFVVGKVSTLAGPVPQVSSSLSRADRIGAYKARWGIGRMDYKIDPGLYALGEPGADSPVLVSANYKMSFDRLRGALPGRSAWILVLDTKGVNVWCAAGKGTFGTTELVSRIDSSGLKQVVSLRKLILPQLGAPGVAAHLVKKLSGFGAIYGPIRATDVPAFLDRGYTATPDMRIKTFAVKERGALIPVELVGALKWALMVMPALMLLGALLHRGTFWGNLLDGGLYAALAVCISIVAGAVLTPLLLPWLPGRAFSVKGASMGLLGAGVWAALRWQAWTTWSGRVEIIAWCLIIPAVSAFVAMNFTGASTCTSLSGVRKEMRAALPVQISACVIGLLLWIGALVSGLRG